ncbi:MAG: exo-alpha-sialidase, partial [bacterium]|nr:exo-alpha-sialidase [bacterium]
NTGFGAEVSPPEPLHLNADADAGPDWYVQITTDGAGHWVATWHSNSTLGGTIGEDHDLLLVRSTDNGAGWTDPVALNSGAGSDTGADMHPQLTTDGAGHWVVVFQSSEPLGASGTDFDIAFARSTDNGVSWTTPQPLNSNAAADGKHDQRPQLTTDGDGNWIVVWHCDEPAVAGGVGDDFDIFFARSTDNGVNWSDVQPLNSNAAGDSRDDNYPQLTTDGEGNWVAVWSSEEPLVGGNIGTDHDLLFARSLDDGLSWSDPAPLNSNAGADVGEDYWPQITTDGAGHWIAVWHSNNELPTPVGDDYDILMAHSTDGGATWTDPAPLATNAASDAGWDLLPQVTQDGAGQWVAVWYSNDPLDGTLGDDSDILVARSTDAGASWTDPQPLNTNAATDSGSDSYPEVTTSGGQWVAGWHSSDTLDGTLGEDFDVLFARFTGFCSAFVDRPGYGTLLFPPRCSRSAGDLTQDPYDVKQLAIQPGELDEFYLSADGASFAGLVVDDRFHIDGVDCGPGGYVPRGSELLLDVPIEYNWIPEPPHEVTDCIPAGTGPVSFECFDTDRLIYGHTALYLLRDCGIRAGTNELGQTELGWISHDVEVGGMQSDLEAVTGSLSDLRTHGDFSAAVCLGVFADTTRVTDTRPDPTAGDGWYYLVRGTCANEIGYGRSTLTPDPREALADRCP